MYYAEQAGAQALVHFGPACLSPPARPLPVAFVLGQRSVALELCAKAFGGPELQTHSACGAAQ